MVGQVEYAKESWFLVFAALVLNLTFGLTISFGVFFSTIIAEFGWARGTTAVAYSAYTIVYGTSTILMAWLSDRYSVSKVVALGVTIVSAGVALASLTTEVWHLYLTYGAMVGLGLGAFWVPPLLVVSKSFDKSARLKTAVAIVTAGTGVGTFLLPPLSAAYIVNFGWRTALQLMGLTIFFIALPSIIVMRPKRMESKIEENERREYNASEIFRSKTYWLIFSGNFLASIGQATIVVHLPAFAVDGGMTLTIASVAVGVGGIGTVLGRLMFAGPLGRMNVQKTLTLVLFLQALLLALLINVKVEFLLYAFSFSWGVLWGARVFFFPILLRGYFGLAAFGIAYGFVNTAFGFGGLVGPPVAGYFYDITGSYFFGFLAASAAVAIGGVALFLAGRTPSGKKV